MNILHAGLRSLSDVVPCYNEKEVIIFAGLQEASGQYTVVRDADLKDPSVLFFFVCIFYRSMAKLNNIEVVDEAKDFR